MLLTYTVVVSITRTVLAVTFLRMLLLCAVSLDLVII